MTISPDEANQLAELLNQICSITIEALAADDPQQRRLVATSLQELYNQFDESSEVAPFLAVLVAWLGGVRPEAMQTQTLTPPFQRALQTMIQQAPETNAASASAPPEPVSRHVLTQLISMVIAAGASADTAVQRTLAAQLVDIRAQLDADWQARLGPLLDNLRVVLDGAEPQTLPAVPDPAYQRLWLSAVELLTGAALNEDEAREQLLERLTHNARFVQQASHPELTESLLRSLLDVQRQALSTGATDVATLIAAIRAHLQGIDATPFSVALQGDVLAAWLKIVGGAGKMDD